MKRLCDLKVVMSDISVFDSFCIFLTDYQIYIIEKEDRFNLFLMEV